MSCTFHGCKIYKIFHNNVQDWTHDAQRSRNGYFHGNYPAAKTIRDLGATSTQRLRLSSILLLRFFNSLYFLRLGVPVSPFLPLPLLLCFLDIRSMKNGWRECVAIGGILWLFRQRDRVVYGYDCGDANNRKLFWQNTIVDFLV